MKVNFLHLGQIKLDVYGLFWLAVVAAVPSLIALAIFGVIQTPDSPGYLSFAEQIRTSTVPSGTALLQSSASPISLYRIGGFPALLAMLQSIQPQYWRLILVLLQISVQSVLVILTYLTALKLHATPRLALLASFLPALGFAVVANICVLTDSLYSAAIVAAAFSLILSPFWRGALISGMLIAFATSFREATIFLVLAYVPLAFLTKRKLLCIALLVLPCWMVATAQISWNVSRGAGPVLTTSAQIVMVQAVLPLLKDHLPVYNTSDTFDKVANQTVGVGGYNKINDLQTTLFKSYGLTAPEIAKQATERYLKTWMRFPGAMLIMTLQDFSYQYLAMPFQPTDTVSTLMVYSNWTRPTFYRLNILWRNLTHGDFVALLWIFNDIIMRLFGTVIAVYGLISPWFPSKNKLSSWDLRALWCVPVGLAGLYMPVHLEPRYLIPAVPVICVLAAAAFTRRHSDAA